MARVAQARAPWAFSESEVEEEEDDELGDLPPVRIPGYVFTMCIGH